MSYNAGLYNSWRRMHTRCYDEAYHSYHRYGGRGITVCPRWHSYKDFCADMESTHFAGATLEREDNDAGYSPFNCKWLPKAENTKPLKYDLQEMLELYNSGLTQAKVGAQFGLTQDRVSKLLKRARNAA